MVSKNLLLHRLSYTNYKTHCWKPWRGCSMNVFPHRVVEVHIKKNLEMKILVLVMDFMTISAMVMVVVVVDSVLIFISKLVDGVLIFINKVVDGVLIFMISMEEDMDMIVMCIFMMISNVMVVVGVVTMISVLEEIAEMVVCSI